MQATPLHTQQALASQTNPRPTIHDSTLHTPRARAPRPFPLFRSSAHNCSNATRMCHRAMHRTYAPPRRSQQIRHVRKRAARPLVCMLGGWAGSVEAGDEAVSDSFKVLEGEAWGKAQVDAELNHALRLLHRLHMLLF